MFSTFGNIFVTRPRHAETTDTRQGIRRHDPDQESRRKKGEGETSDALFDTDDSATVTVEALRIFLENFLKSLDVKKPENARTNPAVAEPQTSPEIPTSPAQPVDGEAAKAAGVYQHVAQKVDRTAAPPAPESMETAPSADMLLAASDIRAIHKLLEDLKLLAARGIDYLTIERSDSFLNSLIAAVAKATNS